MLAAPNESVSIINCMHFCNVAIKAVKLLFCSSASCFPEQNKIPSKLLHDGQGWLKVFCCMKQNKMVLPSPQFHTQKPIGRAVESCFDTGNRTVSSTTPQRSRLTQAHDRPRGTPPTIFHQRTTVTLCHLPPEAIVPLLSDGRVGPVDGRRTGDKGHIHTIQIKHYDNTLTVVVPPQGILGAAVYYTEDCWETSISLPEIPLPQFCGKRD